MDKILEVHSGMQWRLFVLVLTGWKNFIPCFGWAVVPAFVKARMPRGRRVTASPLSWVKKLWSHTGSGPSGLWSFHYFIRYSVWAQSSCLQASSLPWPHLKLIFEGISLFDTPWCVLTVTPAAQPWQPFLHLLSWPTCVLLETLRGKEGPLMLRFHLKTTVLLQRFPREKMPLLDIRVALNSEAHSTQAARKTATWPLVWALHDERSGLQR